MLTEFFTAIDGAEELLFLLNETDVEELLNGKSPDNKLPIEEITIWPAKYHALIIVNVIALLVEADKIEHAKNLLLRNHVLLTENETPIRKRADLDDRESRSCTMIYENCKDIDDFSWFFDRLQGYLES
jgi:hypothetical protein